MSTQTVFHKKRMAHVDTRPPLERYTQGRCGEFAMALYIEFGYPIVMLDTKVAGSKDPLEYSEGLHAFCQHPRPDHLVDVRGVQPRLKALMQWSGFRVKGEIYVLRTVVLPWDEHGWGLEAQIIEDARHHIRTHFDRYDPCA